MMNRLLLPVLLLLPVSFVRCAPPGTDQAGKDQHRWIGRWEATIPATKRYPERTYRLVNREDGTCLSILKSKGQLPQSAKGTWKIISEKGDTLQVEVVVKKTGKTNIVTAVFDGNDKFTLDDPAMKSVKTSAFVRDK